MIRLLRVCTNENTVFVKLEYAFAVMVLEIISGAVVMVVAGAVEENDYVFDSEVAFGL
ncbi:hypothetical protein A2U01_0079742, partial [Trifolium medium]|nr:hypothetical protein [Trifolium medium]